MNVELERKIYQVCRDYRGQGDALFMVLGMMTAGQFFGWRVVRLIASRRQWTLANELFGDPKFYFDEYGEFWRKSVGMKLMTSTHHYWQLIRGEIKVPKNERVMLDSSV